MAVAPFASRRWEPSGDSARRWHAAESGRRRDRERALVARRPGEPGLAGRHREFPRPARDDETAAVAPHDAQLVALAKCLVPCGRRAHRPADTGGRPSAAPWSSLSPGAIGMVDRLRDLAGAPELDPRMGVERVDFVPGRRDHQRGHGAKLRAGLRAHRLGLLGGRMPVRDHPHAAVGGVFDFHDGAHASSFFNPAAIRPAARSWAAAR